MTEEAASSGAVERSWRDTLLALGDRVHDAIRCLDRTGFQIVLVTDSAGVLIGTITDGDIRRGLLRGVAMTDPVSAIVRREPLVVPLSMDRTTVLSLMRANVFSAIPIVDEGRRVVGLHLLKELLTPAPRRNQMVIMAGGRGSRLWPLTEHCPKPLLPVGGRPMLEHIVDKARAEGLTDLVIAVNYLGHMIEEHFGDGAKWGVRISYLRETTSLGTAGPLTLLPPSVDLPLIVTNADVLSDVRYTEVLDYHVSHAADATMAVRLYEWRHPYGVVNFEGVDILGFEEKPVSRTYVNAGIYVLEPRVLSLLVSGTASDMPSLFASVKSTGGRTVVYPMHEPWLDAGLPEDLERAEHEHQHRVARLESGT